MFTRRNWKKTGPLLSGLLTGVLLSGQGLPEGANVVDFEDLSTNQPPLEAYEGPGGGAYYNGSDGEGGFTSAGVRFINNYNADWMSWSGWAYSTTSDTETAGYGNQYSSYTGQAGDGNVYAITYAPVTLELPAGWKAPHSILVSNSTYAALSMRDGDAFARQFGDNPETTDVVETDYPDSFRLIIEGLSEGGAVLGTAEAYLADYRGNAEEDYLLEEWLEVDLSEISSTGTGWGGGLLSELRFSLESTDIGAFGMNTPAYIAIDRLVLEPTDHWGYWDTVLSKTIDTGSLLGWIHVEGEYVYVYDLAKWVYVAEPPAVPGDGAWIFVPLSESR